jgi:hypothetical protein
MEITTSLVIICILSMALIIAIFAAATQWACRQEAEEDVAYYQKAIVSLTQEARDASARFSKEYPL